MTERLSWSRIKSLYRGQWVELIDFEWDWESHYPAWACVRHHHYDRNELLRLIEQSPAKKETVLLYLGAIGTASALQTQSTSLDQ